MFKKYVDDEISLVLMEPALAPVLFKLYEENHDYLARWLAWPAFTKEEKDIESFAVRSLKEYAEQSSLNVAIEYKGEIVGVSGYNTIDPKLSKAIIGYWIIESAQGKGIVTRVCNFLIEYAFESLGLHKVEIHAATGNVPSRGVCERLGMTLEGIITNNERVGETIVDHAIYGIHNKSWPGA